MLRRRVGLVVVVVGVHLVSPFRCCVMVLPLFTGAETSVDELPVLHGSSSTAMLLSTSGLQIHQTKVKFH